MTFFFLFVLGLIIGSFLNVCIYRLPRALSIHRPRRSFCPACDHSLTTRDLVPVLSFLLQRGKCRYCRAPISWRYPAVELLAGIAFLLAGTIPVSWLQLIPILVFISVLIVLFFTDVEHYIVPDAVTFPGIVFFLAVSFLQGRLVDALWAMVIGAGFFILILILGKYFYKQDVMGWGDVKLVAMLGAFLGVPLLIGSLYLSFILGSVIGVFLLATKLKSRKDLIPFAPFLILGALPALYAGDAIKGWLFKFF